MYFKELPEINHTSYFMVKNDAHTTLVSDWLDYIDFVIQNFGENETTNEKNYFSKLKQSYIGGSKNFDTSSDKVKETIGLGGEFQVLTEIRTASGYQYSAKINYDELTNLFFSKKDSKTRYIKRQQIIDKFFLYQWAKGKLLYPAYLDRDVINRSSGNKDFITNSQTYNEFCKWIDNRKYDNPTTSSLMKSTFLLIITSTTWFKLKDITDNGICDAERMIFDKEMASQSRGKNILYCLNELRRMLIFYGRTDIGQPKFTKQKVGLQNSEPFDFVDLQIYPNLEEIVLMGRRFLNVCEIDGLSKGTIKHLRLSINHLFKYLMQYYKGCKIDIEAVNNMFHPDNKANLRAYLVKNGLKSQSVIHTIVRFFDYCELATNFAKNHVPKFKRQPIMPLRKAMPVEMLRHLKEILINRPPNPQTKWDSSAIDTSLWWKHTEVYPIFPLMVLFHLMIPIRGGQLRHLCRKQSFIIDNSGSKIESFVINTDKNVNRKELQTIDNVWEDLNIFSDFLKWHFEYFPNLLPIKYKDDDNSPWEDIYPLFMIPGKFKPISERTHYAYFKKLLCIYQIEKNNILIKDGHMPYVNVVSRNDGEPVFTTIQEAQNASLAIFDKYYKAVYDIHSLRVTGVTRYLEAGLNFKMVMMLTGHKTPAMVLDTYNRLNFEERQAMLSSAYKKVFLGIDKDMVQNTKEFVYNELGELYQKEGANGLEKGFNGNNLFSLQRKNFSDNEEVQLGINFAKNTEPSTWFPMIHGICPGVQCPQGREKKCSLCPYLITGRIFFDGIAHQTNMALVKFFRLSKDFNNELKTSLYENKPKGELLESIMEEILGWNEIMQKVQDDIKDLANNSMNSSQGKRIVNKSLFNSDIGKTVSLPQEIVYLENEYRASIIGVESDKESVAMLTIMAFQIANSLKDDAIYAIANDSKKVLDYLMGHYTSCKSNGNIESFIGLIKGVLPQKII